MRKHLAKPPDRIIICAFFAVLLVSCLDLGGGNANLTAKSATPAPGPDCASCHAYPLRDTNHVFHLFETDSNITSDRPVTCLNCHDRALASRMVPYADSIYRDSSGNEFHALDFPEDKELRTFALVRIDTLIKRRPVPLPPRPGALPEIQEWMTSLDHMNGTVDVTFDSTSIDTARFHGVRAEFNLREQTCSSVDCHPNHGVYRWAIPSRSLPMLTGDTLLH